MNFSDVLNSTYEFLSYRKIEKNEEMDALIKSCYEEIEHLNSFKYIYVERKEFLDFLNNEPYLSFINGCEGYYIVATTLGVEVDRLIKRYSITDMVRAVVLDTVAGVYLEEKANEYEKTLGDNLSYRFCPGYQGSSLSDLKYLFEVLNPEKIGISLLDSGMMIPQKSMCGIIAIGKNEKKSCGKCICLNNCAFRKVGKRCYNLVNK